MRKKMFGGVLVFLVALSFALASTGFSSDYNSGAPLVVGAGESVDAVFGRVQNTGDDDLTFKIELIEGSDIAVLTDSGLDAFVVSAGSTNNPISVRISIPEDVAEGSEYDVVIRVSDVTPSEGTGMVTMIETSQHTLPVLVGGVEEEVPVDEGMSVWWWVLIIVVLIVVVWVVYRIMKR